MFKFLRNFQRSSNIYLRLIGYVKEEILKKKQTHLRCFYLEHVYYLNKNAFKEVPEIRKKDEFVEFDVMLRGIKYFDGITIKKHTRRNKE